MALLKAGFLAVAHLIQEAATAMSHADIQSRISDDLNDQCRGTGKWCYLVAVFGDDKAGDCVYSCDGELCKAPYSCDTTGAKVDMSKAVDVVPLTTYETESTEVSEAGRRNSARDQKQIQTIHDHASALGATCGMAESKAPANAGQLKLTESVAFSVDIPLREAFSIGTKIKLISPGKGSTAWYTESALKQAATDKIFHAGLPMRIDHPTEAESSQRPEGSVKDWGAVLSKDAEWLESYVDRSGKDLGKGLYSEIKPFSDHAQTIAEKGPYAGVSIMANGNALVEAGRTVVKEGVPVLAKFTSAEGADMVTRAGAGGMFLTEAARTANPQEGGAADMDAAEVTKLVEAAVKAALAPVLAQQVPLTERAIRGDAREEATRILASVTLHEAAKTMVIENVLRDIPQKDGALDTAKFKETVDAEAKRVGAAFSQVTGGARVTGMGSAPVQIDAKEAERRTQESKDSEAQAISIFESLGMSKEAASAAAKGRAA